MMSINNSSSDLLYCKDDIEHIYREVIRLEYEISCLLRGEAITPPGPDPAPKEYRLTDNQADVITALHDLEAFSYESKETTKDIVTEAKGKNGDPDNYKHTISDLRKLGLVDTQCGRGGGCWLTPEGKEVAGRYLQ